MERIFEDAPLHKRSFMQRLLKQYPEENAVIVLNNWLSRKPIRSITAQQLAKLCKRHKTNIFRNYTRNLEEIYASYLNFCFRDHLLSREEMDDLNHLKEIFQISNDRAEWIYNLVAERVYKHSFEEVLRDGVVDESERNFIQQLKAKIKIPNTIAEKIAEELKGDYLKNYIDHALNDRELSPEEERELQLIALNIGITLGADEKTKNHLQRCKIYWAIENQELPVIPVSLKLQSREHCHYSSPADWYELKEDAYTRIDSGIVYLTNLKVIFVGENKITNIHLGDILSSTIMIDGVEIDREVGADPVIRPEGDAEIMGRILRKLMK